jgi:hypothetical protein
MGISSTCREREYGRKKLLEGSREHSEVMKQREGMREKEVKALFMIFSLSSFSPLFQQLTQRFVQLSES